jgi:hypothetical protein
MPRLPTVLDASVFALVLASAPPTPAAERAAPTLDPAHELPRVAPKDAAEALATWRVRPGLRLELAAHEPQAASPIAAGMTLRLMGGAEVTLARAEIAGTTSGGRSLMPEGLEQGLTPAQVADLVTFIESLGNR